MKMDIVESDLKQLFMWIKTVEGKDFNPETPVVTYNEGLGDH